MRKAWILAAALLGFVLVALFFTDLCLFGFEAHFLPTPITLFAVFAAAVVALASLRPRLLAEFIRSRFVVWLLVFLAITLGWFFMTIQNEDYFAFLRQRLYSLGFLSTCLLLMSVPEARRVARITLAFAVVMGVAFNITDLVQPLTFSPFIARATGLYLNPNVAGVSLVLGAVAAWEVVPARFRSLFYGLVLVGVIPTFSRSSIAMIILLGPALCLGGQMRWREWGLTLATVAGLAVGGGTLLLASGWIPVDSSQMQDVILRVSLSSEDYSTADRLQVLREVVAMIGRSPLVGHGTGASYLWSLDRSSHNAYLNLMADHGIWAVVILPALFASLARRTYLCTLFIACWLVTGFVTHNLLDETSWLALLAFTPYLGETLESARSR